MKNYFKTSTLLLGVALGVSLYSCKKDKKETDTASTPETNTYYDITDIYPGTTYIEVDPSSSTAEVNLNKKETTTEESAPQPAANNDSKADVVADVPVTEGGLITDETMIVGGFLSLDFNNVMTSPTGNVVGDVDIVKGNLVTDESDGIMDVHIETVEELDEVVIKDGIENTHMMKGAVRMNGKKQDFEVPVNINQANEKFELLGIVDFDRSHFFSEDAFNHLSAEDLMNDNIKVRVRINSKGTAGKISIYDADKNITEKVKFREHGEHMSTKVKEKGDGFKDKDKIMERHDRKIEKMKEKAPGDMNKEKIREINGKTIEKLTHRQKKLETHKERLKMKQDEIMEKYKDKDKETGEKEKIKIDEKMSEIDAKIKEIDDEKNRLKAKATSTDGGLNNPNPAGGE